MPTKRTRRTRNRFALMPTWAEQLREGIAPKRGTDDWRAFCGWYFFGDTVESLPRYDSEEGRELIARLPEGAL